MFKICCYCVDDDAEWYYVCTIEYLCWSRCRKKKQCCCDISLGTNKRMRYMRTCVLHFGSWLWRHCMQTALLGLSLHYLLLTMLHVHVHCLLLGYSIVLVLFTHDWMLCFVVFVLIIYYALIKLSRHQLLFNSVIHSLFVENEFIW